VQDRARFDVAVDDRHVRGVDDQAGAKMVGQLPTDDHPVVRSLRRPPP
jgi:hypothetical protein